MVRYEIEPDQVEDNERLVRAVYAELVETSQRGSATRRS